jgi:peptidoglycan/xylan/chitin deacetylase (PgdA/CDA1 family)
MITTDIFRQFIEYYLKHDYLFISPDDIMKGLRTDKKYVLITFDDGYFSNQLSLPILNEYKVPATYFISANHIVSNKNFWWDVVYRERMKRNSSAEQIFNESRELKLKKNQEIEQYIIDNFGEKALHPISDIDRPFTPAELLAFSRDPLVSFGNHTTNHAILTNYSYSEIKSEISVAQDEIFKLTGVNPVTISYPNGNFSQEVISVAKEMGFKLGITINPGKNYLPISFEGNNPFILNRFTLWGNKNIEKQCNSFRNDIHLRNFLLKIATGKEPEKINSY